MQTPARQETAKLDSLVAAKTGNLRLTLDINFKTSIFLRNLQTFELTMYLSRN